MRRREAASLRQEGDVVLHSTAAGTALTRSSFRTAQRVEAGLRAERGRGHGFGQAGGRSGEAGQVGPTRVAIEGALGRTWDGRGGGGGGVDGAAADAAVAVVVFDVVVYGGDFAGSREGTLVSARAVHSRDGAAI